MSSLAGALLSPPPQHDTLHAERSASPKAEDAEMENMDDIKPAFAQSADLHDDGKEEDDQEELNDLFGGDEDVNMVEHHEPTSSAASDHADQDDGLSSPERHRRERLEYAEEDEPEQVIEQRLEADVAIPNIPVPRSSDGSYWVIRMPNFIKVDSKPFHPDTYVGPEQEDEDAGASESLREKSMSIKLKVENTVRWRWSKDGLGQDRRQSNSRIVRWSDGSLSLQLGKELFDITQSIDTSGTVPRQALGGSQSSQHPASQSQSQSQAAPAGQGLTYLVAQHKRAEILQCEALITGYMSLRPTGMQSETHRMLVRAVGQKHTRVARLRMAPEPTTDPERERLELEKAAARKPRKSRAAAGDDDFGFGGGSGGGGSSSARRRRSGYARKRTGDDMWSDDEDDDVGFGRGGSEDEYGDEGASRKGKRKPSGDDSGRKGPGEYLTDDFLVADTDEDEDFAEDEGRRRKRKRAGRDAEEEEDEDAEDDLERLEAKISQNEAAERKRRQRDGGDAAAEGAASRDADADAAGEDAMDVESEEEEDDFAPHRSRPSGPRKRRALGLEDEEEEE
ncbi:Leo1-like protein-domain-containing protein [Trametes polyzona]|nr:Leo1-like protein-domain-containing protein [Trametes polyzona]